MLELQVRLYNLLYDHRINTTIKTCSYAKLQTLKSVNIGTSRKNVEFFRVLRIISSVKRFSISTTQ